MFKKKKSFSPIMTFLILTLATVIVSGVLHLFNVQSEYASISKATDGLVNNVIEVNNLFSISGLRHIVSSAVNGFVNFGPLSILIIVLILVIIYFVLRMNYAKKSLERVMGSIYSPSL